MFPDPETFDPTRWIKPESPVYKEPLSKFPTILNCTQFGYGRRTCQGQTVSEADLIVGIASIAWLFNIKANPKPSQSLQVPESPMSPLSPAPEYNEKMSAIMTNINASISNEELVTGMSVHSSDDEDEFDDGVARVQQHPGAFPKPTRAELHAEYLEAIEKARKAQEEEENKDPTLVFTSLLIAKPLPFKFQLTVRNRERASMVQQLFKEQKEKGEFVPSREYWGENQGADKPLGWGKV